LPGTDAVGRGLLAVVLGLVVGLTGCGGPGVTEPGPGASATPAARAPTPAPTPTPTLEPVVVPVDQRVNVLVYADAPAGEGMRCRDLLPYMVPLSAVGKVPAQGCIMDITAATRLEFVQGQGDVLYLYRVEILTYWLGAHPGPWLGIRDCFEILPRLQPADVAPTTARVVVTCRYQPLPRGHVHDRVSRVWFLIPLDAGVRPEEIPEDVHCWELTRYLGPPRGDIGTFPVPCTLD